MVREPSGPPFIGRRAELGVLQSALSDALQGRPRAVLVAGEAGVGKSRFVSHFLGRPACRGTWTMSGVCIDVSGESLPYGPLRDALRTFFETIAERDRKNIIDSVPATLQSPFLGAGSTGGLPSDTPAPNALAFEGLLDLTRAAADIRPLIVVLEDLHWADSSSLACVKFLLAQLRSDRVLVVGTYRSDELHRTHRLQPWLAEQLRRDLVELIDLPRLDRSETEQLVGAVFGSSPPAHVTAGIYERSEGNAFFVEELARTAPEQGEELPTTLREILLARIRVLRDDVQRLLRIAAVGGRSIDPDLLSEVAGIDHKELFDLLRESVAGNVVVTQASHGGFSFRHALLHEVTLSEVLPGEVERLHVAYADRLIQRTGESADSSRLLSRIARHLWSARRVDEALTFAIRAGDAALAVNAFDTAHEQFERALSLWSAATDRSKTGIDRAELLQRTAGAAHLAGDDDRAIGFLTAAIDDVDAGVDPVRVGLLYEKLGWYHFMGGPRIEAFAAYERALELVPEDPSRRERARILGAYARQQMLWSRYEESIELAEAAIDLAKSVGAPREEGIALNPLGTSLVMVGDAERGLDYLRRSVAMAAEVGDHDERSRGYINLGEMLSQLGQTKEAIDVWLEGFDHAHQAGLRARVGGFLLSNVAELLLHRGDWQSAEATLEEAERWVSPGFNQSWWSAVAGRLMMRRGDLAAARARLEGAMLGSRDGHPHIVIDSQRDLAELALWEGRLEEAYDLVVSTLPFMSRHEPHLIGLAVMLGLRVIGERAAVPGTSDSVRTAALEDARAMIDPARSGGIDPLSPPTGAVSRAVIAAATATCKAELSGIEGRSDPQLWGEAAAAWKDGQRPYEEAYASWRGAEALAVAGRRQQAQQALRRAAGLAGGLGAKLLVREINMLARRARIDLQEPADKEAKATEAAEPAAGLGLTDREIEVLKHVGLGRTNAEIAALLFISPKTASVHVSNIMRKLGVSNRIAAARAANKAGLVEESPVPNLSGDS